MIVSWNWLKQYVPLGMPLEELEQRLMMSGLNHEGTQEVGGDLAIELEVTSNRPDCLSHLGVAREVAVLWGSELKLPAADPPEGNTPVSDLVGVRIDCLDLCPRYTARVVRGVKIGQSPQWMARRLAAVGVTAINNVVDISNYVLMECGQPLHTFDFARLKGSQIIVRRPKPGETIEAIDHKTYTLEPQMCVIADAEDAVAIGGVMGGAQTEISRATADILIEAAQFAPVSIRNAARALNLHSESSYRFERGVDPEGIDWASRRCCELILELAGGELARGVVDVGPQPPKREPIVLRFSQLKRILGIDVPAERVRQILIALGHVEVPRGGPLPEQSSADRRPPSAVESPHPGPLPEGEGVTLVPPSWRRDLTREIDLVEEVGRIHGYEAIPEDVSVPLAPSARRREDRVLEKIRHVLTAAGFDEALTLSVVDEQVSALLSPWTDAAPLRSQMPVIRGAECLRRSLVPSLLAVQRTNESLANWETEFFEIAKVYLPHGTDLPHEELTLGMISTRRFVWHGVDEGNPQEKAYRAVRGVIEAILGELKISMPLQADDANLSFLDPELSCRLEIDNQLFGYVGSLSLDGLNPFDLSQDTIIAELRVSPLMTHANLVPTLVPQSPYPGVTRDLSLVVNDSVRWGDIAEIARAEGGPWLESVKYGDVYRDADYFGPGKKSLFFTITLRSSEHTLTSPQADQIREQIVAACREKHGAELRAQ